MSDQFPFSNDLLSAWEDYRKAAKRSARLKKIVNRSRIIGLILLIVGACFGVLADQAGGWNIHIGWLPTAFALTSAITLAIAAFVGRYVLDSQYDKDWVSARSQAEALKSESYVYLVQAKPGNSIKPFLTSVTPFAAMYRPDLTWQLLRKSTR